MVVNIDLTRRHGVFTIVEAFAHYNYTENLIVNVKHQRGRFIANGIYPILCSILNEARKRGLHVDLNFDLPENCSQLLYAERMNFLQCLGLNYFTPFGRNSANGRFIEITNIPKGNYSMSINLMEVFTKDFDLSTEASSDLAFIIGEIYCNTTIHSRSENGCYFYCQKYPNKGYLEVHIVDSGIGIVTSMRKNDKYSGIDDNLLLPLSLEFSEGSGEGRGHGLYFVSEFIRRNNGEMLYLSGNNHIFIGGKGDQIGNNGNYHGVVIKLRFRFDVSVTTLDLMREKTYSNV
tara:strand:+ start:357156 stop:358025 length:870 start_codon:yes stop_codon:yes gene_type:complete